MDVQALHQFVASVPGSFSQIVLRRAMIQQIEMGKTKGAAHLMNLVGIEVIPALIKAGAPAPMIRAAIEKAVYDRYHDLRAVDRAVFAGWCRQGGFIAPRSSPEVMSLYRGTMGVSPAVAATGLHWTPRFESAAIFAARFADTDLTGCIVLHARVPRDEIVCFLSDSAHGEVIPAQAPVVFDVVTDKERIGGAALREAARQQEIQAHFGRSVRQAIAPSYLFLRPSSGTALRSTL